MEISKIAVGIFLACSLFACNEGKETVSKESYDEAVEQVKKYQQLHKEALDNANLQGDIIETVLQQLSEITQSTSRLKVGVENQSLGLTRAEKIENQINVIKAELEKEREKSKGNAKMEAIIDGLNKLVEEKETEIRELKKQLLEKDAIINNYEFDIKDIRKKLGEKNEELNKLSASAREQQAKLWYDMGKTFEDMASNLESYKRENTKKKRQIARTKVTCIEKALECYGQAENFGHPDALASFNRMVDLYNTTNR